MQDSSFYKLQSSAFRNSLYSLDISIRSKFVSEYFLNDTTRVIMARNNWALRERATNNDINTLNLPFMNYKATKIVPGTERPWFNLIANVDGVYIDEIRRKLKVRPITIKYNATMWFSRDDDMQYAYQKLSYDNAVEIIVPYYIAINAQDIKMIAILKYNLEFEPVYTEREWLRTNKLHSIAIDFEAQTFYIEDNEANLTKQVLFDFKIQNQLGDISDDEALTILVNQYTEENIIA